MNANDYLDMHLSLLVVAFQYNKDQLANPNTAPSTDVSSLVALSTSHAL